MKRKIIVILTVIICFLLQSTIFKFLSFASISPNLLIIVTSSFGFMRGKKKRMVHRLQRSKIMTVSSSSISVQTVQERSQEHSVQMNLTDLTEQRD